MDLVSGVPHRIPGNHYVLSSDNIITHTMSLRRLEEQLQDLDNEINGLRDHLCSALQQKELLVRGGGLQRPLLAPVHRLLPELLQEIFQYCLPSAHNPVMSNKGAPILLGQVCSWWRKIALGTPTLWAAIHVSIPEVSCSRPYFGHKVETLRIEGIRHWLSRSAVLPLSISLSESCPPPPFGRRHFSGISSYLEVLSSFSSRWKTIVFQIFDFDWVTDFFTKYQISNLPMLENLRIDGSRYMNSSPEHKDTLSAENSVLRSPHLRQVSLPVFEELILYLPLPWTQLRELDLSCLPGTPLFQVMETLSLCRNLVTLSVCSESSSHLSDPALEQTLTFPNLRALNIIDLFRSPCISRFLNHISAPAIRQIGYARAPPFLPLEGEAFKSQSKNLMNALALFASRAVDPIDALSLRYDWLTEEEITKILSILPGLKRLSIYGNGQPQFYDWGQLRDALPLQDGVFSRLFTIPRKRRVVFGGGSVGGDIRIDDAGAESDDASTFDDDFTQDERGKRGTYNLLCPGLEVFHCVGAMFSGTALLEFLQARSVSCEELGVSRIRSMHISFAEAIKNTADTIGEEIELVQREMGVSMSIHCERLRGPEGEDWEPPSPVRYSPYDGLRVPLTVFVDLDGFVFNAAF